MKEIKIKSKLKSKDLYPDLKELEKKFIDTGYLDQGDNLLHDIDGDDDYGYELTIKLNKVDNSIVPDLSKLGDPVNKKFFDTEEVDRAAALANQTVNAYEGQTRPMDSNPIKEEEGVKDKIYGFIATSPDGIDNTYKGTAEALMTDLEKCINQGCKIKVVTENIQDLNNITTEEMAERKTNVFAKLLFSDDELGVVRTPKDIENPKGAENIEDAAKEEQENAEENLESDIAKGESEVITYAKLLFSDEECECEDDNDDDDDSDDGSLESTEEFCKDKMTFSRDKIKALYFDESELTPDTQTEEFCKDKMTFSRDKIKALYFDESELTPDTQTEDESGEEEVRTEYTDSNPEGESVDDLDLSKEWNSAELFSKSNSKIAANPSLHPNGTLMALAADVNRKYRGK